MTRRNKITEKIRVAPERLGDLVHDLDQLFSRGALETVRYYESGMNISVRPVWNSDGPARELVVFLNPDVIDALADQNSRAVVANRYASVEKSAE